MKIITPATLDRLIMEQRTRGAVILAPRELAYGIDFAPITVLADMSIGHVQTIQSPKSVLFPRVEELLRFRRSAADYRLEEPDLQAAPQIVLLGAKPCDAAGFLALEAIFHWDTTDPQALARREKLVVVTIACTQADAACFCTSVGLHPSDSRGSDILLKPLADGGYGVGIVSEKGREWLQGSGSIPLAEAETATPLEPAQVPVAFPADRLTAVLPSLFPCKETWLEQSLRCTGCGACAYVCPTCACFDIQDEGTPQRGKRLRCWDSCGFHQFTLHASGHNPRASQWERWRQRVMHKFSYMPERLQTLGCVGCGRCTRSCPVDMDLREHLQELAGVLS